MSTKNDYTPEEQKIIDEINTMSHYQMARQSRYAPVGHPYFDQTKPFAKVFDARYQAFGGMTPFLSKNIGW